MPSLPSTPSRVPSGHGTKSSILYLHSPTVRSKDIIRLSGDPLIQDSLVAPELGFNDDDSDAQCCLRHCKAGSSPNFECLLSSVRPHKCWTSWLLCPIRAIFHASNEYEEPGRFYIRPPSQINKLSIKGMGIIRSDPYHPPPARIHRSALRKNPLQHGRQPQLLLLPP